MTAVSTTPATGMMTLSDKPLIMLNTLLFQLCGVAPTVPAISAT